MCVCVCVRLFKAQRGISSSPDFQSCLPSFQHEMCLTLLINTNSMVLKFRARCSFNCLKTQVSAFNAVDSEAWRAGLRGFVSVCGDGLGGWQELFIYLIL